jgi:hypothetical protein
MVQIPKLPCRPNDYESILFGGKALPLYLIVKVVEKIDNIIPTSLDMVVNRSNDNSRR